MVAEGGGDRGRAGEDRALAAGKLLGGSALLAVALFMVVGFLRADVNPAALRTMVALLIGAGPAAAGGVFETIVEIVAGVFG